MLKFWPKYDCTEHIFGEHRRVLLLDNSSTKEKVAGSALGKLWIVLFPITFLAIYGTVFYVILGIRVPELEASSLYC